MNKFNFLFLAAAGLTLASCSNEDFEPSINSGDGNYSVTIQLPRSYMATRAVEEFGLGTVADQLNIAVYDATSGTLMQEGLVVFEQNSLQTTVDFNLVRGRSYNIAFFAQSRASMNSAPEGQQSNGVYDFNAAAGTVTVNYVNMTSENNLDDAYDCFYNVLPTGVIGTSNVNTSVVLNRPVGQVNWGTDDLTYNDNGVSQDMVAAHDDAYGSQGQYIETTLTVTKPFNRLNLVTGGVSQNYATGDPGQVKISGMAAPYQLEFPLENESETVVYTYVAMTYLLAPKSTSTNYDLNLDINNNGNEDLGGEPTVNNVVSVSAVPVQANYQTNIYGHLLSSNLDLTVKKNPTWIEPAYDVPLKYNGEPTYPEIPEDGSPLIVSSASDLAGLADMISGANGQTANSLEGVEIQLGADFDMDGFELTFGSASSPTSANGATDVMTGLSGNAFAGTFDGQGHTISNVKVSASSNDGTTPEIVGIFPNVTGTVQDVNFSGLVLEGQTTTDNNLLNATGVVGVLNGGNVTNVNVTSGTVTGGNNTGAVVGAVLDGTVTGCNNGASVNGQNKVGGVIGSAYGVDSDSDITITGCNNSGTVTGSWTSGGVIGLSNATVSNCENSGNVTGTNNSIGGVIGEQRTSGSVTGCKNSGNVIVTAAQLGNNLGYGVGGVVGWIRYIPQGNDTATEVISVSTCENSGTIKGGIGAGGIVGIWYAAGQLTGNNNSAPSITAISYGAGGIVGQTNPSTSTNAPGQSKELTLTNNTSTTTWANLSSPTNSQGAEQRGLLVGIDDGSVTYSGNTPESNTPQN